MPLKSINILEMQQSLRSNPHNQWSRGGNSHDPGTDSKLAANRIHRPVLPMWMPPTQHSVTPGASVFAMGSCFAREIERSLLMRGFQVLSRPAELEVPGDRTEGEAVNRYNTPSMLLEFRRLLEGEEVVPDDALLIERRGGIFSDAHYHPVSSGPLSEVLERRRRFYENLRTLKEADFIVITLGLNEAAFEVSSGLYRNVTPTVYEIQKKKPLEVHVLTFAENLEHLEQIYGLVHAHCRKKPLIFITVSPVPLTFTYQLEDIVVSNMAAKSVLRAAAAEFSANHQDVLYFPSFEIALHAHPDAAFKPDKRHIYKNFVDHIVSQFIRAFVSTPQSLPTDESERALPVQ